MQVPQKGSEDDVYPYEGQPEMTRNSIESLPVKINQEAIDQLFASVYSSHLPGAVVGERSKAQ